MNRETILKADPEYRRKVIRIFLSAVIVGFIVLSLVIPMLEKATVMDNPMAVFNAFKHVLVLLLIIPAFLCIYLLRIAIKSIKHRCFPPPDTKVIKDTPILYEEEAVKRGIILLIFAFILIFFCFFSAAHAISFMDTLA